MLSFFGVASGARDAWACVGGCFMLVLCMLVFTCLCPVVRVVSFVVRVNFSATVSSSFEFGTILRIYPKRIHLVPFI